MHRLAFTRPNQQVGAPPSPRSWTLDGEPISEAQALRLVVDPEPVQGSVCCSCPQPLTVLLVSYTATVTLPAGWPN